MKRLIVLTLALVVSTLVCFAQKQKVNVVELQNGTIIRGVILESTEGTIKIQTADKSVFVYPETDVVKITEAEKGTLEKSIILSYYHAFGNVVYPGYGSTNGIVLSYMMDYSISNTPLYLGFGASLGFAHFSYTPGHSTEGYLNSYYFGIPLTVGFKSVLSNNLVLKPFFRLMPILEYDRGAQSGPYVDSKPSKFAFGGVAPELGATLCVSRFLVSLSYGFTWDTYVTWTGYSRLGEHGVYLGVGYLF